MHSAQDLPVNDRLDLLLAVNPVRDLFLAALDTPAAGRDTFLDSACGTDLDLRRRVVMLLAAHDRPDPVLDRPAADALAGDPSTDGLSDDGGELTFLTPADVPGSLGRLGHYTILGVLGRGGMGVVFRAIDDKLGRVVAVKVLPPARADGAARRRFVREARATAAIAHENVTAIFAVEDTGPVPFIVMECVEGRTLQEKLDRDGPLPAAEVLRIGQQIAHGLAAAHGRGLVHRDIKPANVLLEGAAERVKITDFGLARAVDDAHLTQAGVIAGTPQYMSPEQANGHRVGPASDLFSLGSVLYALGTGQLPFDAPSLAAVLKRVSEALPPPPRQANPAVPRRLEAVILRLLAKTPDERFGSATEVGEVLGQLRADLQAGKNLDVAPRRRSRILALALAGIVVAAVAVTAISRPWSPRVPVAEVAPPPATKPEWTPLFNGTDLTGWKVTPSEQANWSVEEGELVTRQVGVFGLSTERTDYENFHLKARIRPIGAAAAIRFRVAAISVEEVAVYSTGFRLRLHPRDGDALTGGAVRESYDLRPGRLGQPGTRLFNSPDTVPADDPWPLVEVICEGPRIRVVACGKTLADVSDAGSRHRRGAIGLTAGGPEPDKPLDVRFKDIEIKELPAD